jgi:hypothetical protein
MSLRDDFLKGLKENKPTWDSAYAQGYRDGYKEGFYNGKMV